MPCRLLIYLFTYSILFSQCSLFLICIKVYPLPNDDYTLCTFENKQLMQQKLAWKYAIVICNVILLKTDKLLLSILLSRLSLLNVDESISSIKG